MKFSHTLIAVTILSLSPSAFASDTLATVNGKVIKQSIYDFIAKDLTASGQKIDAQIKDSIVNQLITTEVAYQEAQKLGLDKQPDFLAREEIERHKLLTNMFIQDFIKKNPVSDADTKAAYEQLKKAYGDKEFNAQHILLKTEDEAKDVITQLNKGSDFAKIVKEKSIDTGSKDKGGDIGWFSPANMKPFVDAVASLKKGAVSPHPVQTQYGWHVIKLIDTRPAQPLDYEKVKDSLQKNLQQRNLEKMMGELRSKAKVEVTK